MKNLLRAEEAAMFIFSIYLLSVHHVDWWVYLLLAVGPDIGMMGYLVNNKVGAILYNLFHHKGIAIAVYVGGVILQNPYLQLAGIILFGHASMDRLFGFGLKYFAGFKHTHLGLPGKHTDNSITVI
jgi:hypothetical protein